MVAHSFWGIVEIENRFDHSLTHYTAVCVLGMGHAMGPGMVPGMGPTGPGWGARPGMGMDTSHGMGMGGMGSMGMNPGKFEGGGGADNTSGLLPSLNISDFFLFV